MNMSMKRRIFLKRSLAVSAVGVAAGAGILTPGQLLAEWPESAFKAASVDDALKGLGLDAAEESGDIHIKAPDIAENGAVVPVTITAKMDGVESITVFAAANGTPLLASYDLTGASGFVSQRCKMAKTGNVVAVVKAGGKTYSAKREVKVTIGGCGG
jgi:sulfur-oxidizing protein SoxY